MRNARPLHTEHDCPITSCIRIGEASHPGPRQRGSGSSDASIPSEVGELVDNVADVDVLDALELDLAGEAFTVVDTVDPTVEDCSGSDGDADAVISEGPDPGAQADHSSEPEIAVSQVVPEV